ncbi:ATP-dependent DNA helicase [Frankliniella fusca]|uniref:ATP-dependent DNA helicase n=1 Tax=Frankliniella fusca TaxID=407009 RepID=A0AAE1LKT6_9NEOP|nr:ATP-dependent DNA helicase [Frankliniella fusca]
MTRRCFVCRKEKGQVNHLFSLPKQPGTRKKWIEWICNNLNVPESSISSSAVVCSDHFNPANIMKRRLKPCSVPEQFVQPNINNIVCDCTGLLAVAGSSGQVSENNELIETSAVANGCNVEHRNEMDNINGNNVLIHMVPGINSEVNEAVAGSLLQVSNNELIETPVAGNVSNDENRNELDNPNGNGVLIHLVPGINSELKELYAVCNEEISMDVVTVDSNDTFRDGVTEHFVLSNMGECCEVNNDGMPMELESGGVDNMLEDCVTELYVSPKRRVCNAVNNDVLSMEVESECCSNMSADVMKERVVLPNSGMCFSLTNDGLTMVIGSEGGNDMTSDVGLDASSINRKWCGLNYTDEAMEVVIEKVTDSSYSDVITVDINCNESDGHTEKNDEVIDVLSSAKESRTKKSIVRKCSVEGCSNNNSSHRLFFFPRVMKCVNKEFIVDDNEVKRCRSWMAFCNNKKLYIKDIRNLHKTYQVCSDHFPDNMFGPGGRLKLKKTAVPILKAPINVLENVDLSCLPGSSSDGNFGNIEGCSSNYDLVEDNPELQNSLCDINRELSNLSAKFEDKLKCMKEECCDICKEKYLFYPNMKKLHRKKSTCWKFSDRNNMDPGVVPPELLGLTFVEQLLIALIHPVLSVFKLKGCQYGYKGNVINFLQDVKSFATMLPYRIEDLNSVLTVTYRNGTEKSSDFQVRAKKVRDALLWLKVNNDYYKDIEISEENLAELPEDGNVYDKVNSMVINSVESEENIDLELDGDLVENEEEPVVNIESSGVPFVPLHNQDQLINSSLDWPNLGVDPVSEFDAGFIVRAFPCLFPYGKCDFYEVREKKVQMHEYFKHLLSYEDGRFGKHPTFRFFAFNMWLRHTAIKTGKVFVDKDSNLKEMNVEELKAHLDSNASARKKIMFMGSNLKGSKSYWKSRCGELRDMVEQIGLPTIFLTMSAADLYWPDLYRILTGKDISEVSMRERRLLIRENPIIVDLFFDYRLQIYIQEVLELKYKVTDYWYRIEYQHSMFIIGVCNFYVFICNRGSPHVHGLFWFEDAPKNVEKLLNGTEEEKLSVKTYFEQLISAVNPNINVEMPEKHPCEVRYGEVEDFESDISQLLLKVQRHTKCTPGYCLRMNKKKETVCRFHFPFDITEAAELKLNEKTGNYDFIPERNDSLLNKYNPFIISTWRANIDICPILYKSAVIDYITKYVSKAEVNSKTLVDICEQVCNATSSGDPARRAIQKILIKNCVERDVSAQEVCHIMMGANLFNSGNRNFVVVHTDEGKWTLLNTNREDGEVDHSHQKSSSSFMEKYANRPSVVEDVSMWNAAKFYNIKNWKKCNKKPNIVRVFPRLKIGGGDDEKYYRQQVMLHVPWSNEKPINKGDDETWQSFYERNRVLISEQLVDLSDRGTGVVEDNDEGENDENENPDVVANEDWMIAQRITANISSADVNPGMREVDLNYDWHANSHSYDCYGDLKYLEKFIENEKKNYEETENIIEDLPDINFSTEQTLVKNVMERQIEALKNGITDDGIPKKVLVQGKAGTGKSLLIRYLVNEATREFGQGSVLLLGPTGVAAVNVGGATIHSALSIPTKGHSIQELTGESARKFCDTIAKVKFVIIDEYSFISCSLLGDIDFRLRQGTGIQEPFGNLNLYLFGDYRQLPPVMNRPLYSSSQLTPEALRGKNLFNSFDCLFVLTQCHRQKDPAFEGILDRISMGLATYEDYCVLRQRFESNVTFNEVKKFDKAIRLFATKEDVGKHNKKTLKELTDDAGNLVPIAIIPAKHNGNGAKSASEDKANGLPNELIMGCGARIMLKRNLWTKKGLVNGTMGSLVDILYDEDNEPPFGTPRILMCQFDNYKGPGIGPNNLVPIGLVVSSWKSSQGSCSRQQFPVVLSYACTIHKSQGLSLDQAVINIGKREFSLGITYVALSRVRSLDGVLLKEFGYERLDCLKNRFELIDRRAFEEKLKNNY